MLVIPENTRPGPTAPIVRVPVARVITQHAAGCSALRLTRSILVRAPHVHLHHLARLDERIEAHVDGLVVAGRSGMDEVVAALASLGVGEAFAAAVLALRFDDHDAWARLLAVAEADHRAARGLVSAMGWVATESLRHVVAGLLDDRSPFRRRLGLLACAMHDVDPGIPLRTALTTDDPGLQACALRICGEQARLDCLPACLDALSATDDECRFQAARSAAFLGDRAASLGALRSVAESLDDRRFDALELLSMLLPLDQLRAPLRALTATSSHERRTIQLLGTIGDPRFVPWLIDRMTEPSTARVAGASFSLVTGLDLVEAELEERSRTESATVEPSQDPVALDADENLPWPDRERIVRWWNEHGGRFATGVRYFIGEVPTASHCLRILKDGGQHQRRLAAGELCLSQPGTRFFNVAAPAWRQQRRLERMAA